MHCSDLDDVVEDDDLMLNPVHMHDALLMVVFSCVEVAVPSHDAPKIIVFVYDKNQTVVKDLGNKDISREI